ncbi:MAG: hypothetical protein ACYDH6_18570 [Acidimicrobiales bacterium]
MSVEDDRESDRRFLAAFGVLMAVEVVLGVLADAGTIGLVVWLVLAVAAVLAAAAVSAVLQRR